MSEKEKKQRTVRLPNVFEALLPIVVMLGLMLYHFMAGTSYGDAHMPLLVSIVVACIIGCILLDCFQIMRSVTV